MLLIQRSRIESTQQEKFEKILFLLYRTKKKMKLIGSAKADIPVYELLDTVSAPGSTVAPCSCSRSTLLKFHYKEDYLQ